MKIERVFLLRFDDGRRIPYGVPEFLSEEEAKDFLGHVQGELDEGAARYFENCCQDLAQRPPGEDDDDDDEAVRDRELTFSHHPTDRVRRLEFVADGLRRLGTQSLAARALREAEIRAHQAQLDAALFLQQLALSQHLEESRHAIEVPRRDIERTQQDISRKPQQDMGKSR